LDNIIDKLKKMKGKKGKDSSPLDEFFTTEEDGESVEEETSSASENDLDIKPIGKPGVETTQVESPPPQQEINTEERKTDEKLAKGIRELSFDDLDSETEEEEEIPQGKTTIEIDSSDPEKVKRIRLIVALLDADQLEAAHQEIDKMLD
jgi:hypothetical protein